jgi:hypothetical protein
MATFNQESIERKIYDDIKLRISEENYVNLKKMDQSFIPYSIDTPITGLKMEYLKYNNGLPKVEINTVICISFRTIDTYNNKSTESNFVTLIDIQNMDPCSFTNGINPITNVKCSESFTTGVSANAARVDMPDDPLAQLYFASLGLVGVYILYRFMEKSR